MKVLLGYRVTRDFRRLRRLELVGRLWEEAVRKKRASEICIVFPLNVLLILRIACIGQNSIRSDQKSWRICRLTRLRGV